VGRPARTRQPLTGAALGVRSTLQPWVRRALTLHALVTDGCFEDTGGDPVFYPTHGLERVQLHRTLSGLHADLAQAEADAEPDVDIDEAVVACVQLGLAWEGSDRSGEGPRPQEASRAELLVADFGMQLHADVAVDGRDRARLERLCRYMLRPPFAQSAVEETADGQVRVHFKKPRRSGATYAQMRPEIFVARLCALVPPPRKHMVLYYGVLSARHRLRAGIIPQREREDSPEQRRHKQLALFVPMGCVERAGTGTLLERQLKRAAPSRLSWAVLLARVFGIDGLECERCGGPMRIVAVVKTADAIAAELHGARPPPKPWPAGQLGLFEGVA
jgi:hypothetical protein